MEGHYDSYYFRGSPGEKTYYCQRRYDGKIYSIYVEGTKACPENCPYLHEYNLTNICKHKYRPENARP